VNYQKLEKNLLLTLKLIMFPIMLLVYIILCADQGDVDFQWGPYLNSLEAAIKQYWSN